MTMPFSEFAERVLRLDLTPAWRVLVRVSIDDVQPRDLDGEERDLARELLGDVDEVPALARRLLVWILGRESWKTTVAGACALYTLAVASLAGTGPGDVPVFIAIAPDKRTASLVIRVARDLARRVPSLDRAIVAETAEGFTLRRPTDGRLVAFEAFAVSRAGANLRGRSILGAVLDESMFFYSDGEGDYVRTDRDVYRAIVPRLMRGGRIIFISTPWPCESLTGELYALNYGHPVTAIAARAPTLLMRGNDPDLAERIAAERAADPIDTARERDADMTAMGGAGTLFDAGALDRAVDATLPLSVPPLTGASIGAAMDLAFRSDASALAIVARHGSEFALLHVDELRPSATEALRPSEVIATFAATMRRYGVRRAWADQHCIEPVREYLAAEGISLIEAPAGAAGKVETHLLARAIVHEGRFIMPRHSRALAQLKAIRSKPAPGGGLSIWSPRRKGAHGDIASAIVLAVWAAEQVPAAGSLRVYLGGPRTFVAPTEAQILGKSTPAQHAAVHGIPAGARRRGTGW